jgi:hypothetical protein
MCIPVTGSGGLYICEMLAKIILKICCQVALTSASSTGRDLLRRDVSVSDTHLCYRLSIHESLKLPEVIYKLIRIIHLIGYRTRELPACSMAT